MLCPSCQTENDESAENCFKCGKGLFVLTEGSVLASRYEILSPLGRGGMGMVYKAHDVELDELVAIKVLRSDAAASPGMAKRFRSEIKLARRVSHPNVCRIHELGKQGPLSYIVMEYVDGVDFRRILRERGRLPAEEAYSVVVQLADALQAIHTEGIIHRDLKTPNVMRNTRGVVKLMDFGIAKSFEAGTTGATATGDVVGTPEYMSPEQAQGGKLDARSDIYALGIVTFELFTAVVPFRSDTPLATLLKHIHDPPPLAETPELPRALLPALSKALAKAPQDRFQSAREFGDAVRLAARQTSQELTLTSPITPMRTGAAALVMPETASLPTPVPTSVPTVVPPPTAALGREATPRPSASRPSRPSRPTLPPPIRPPQARGRGPSTARLLGTTAAVVLLAGGAFFWIRGGGHGRTTPPDTNATPSPNDQRGPATPTPTPDGPEPPAVKTLEAPLPLTPRGQAELSYADLARAATPLSWKPVSGASSYHLMLDRGQSFSRPLLDRKGVRDTSLQLAGLGEGTYYWRVAAVGTDGREGPFSPAMDFTITRPMAPPREPRETLPPSPPAVSTLPAPVTTTPPPRATLAPPPATAGAAPPSPTPGGRAGAPGSPEGAATAGTLQVLIIPWAEVEVDGVKVGVSPPLKPLALPAGTHAIKLTHPDYLPFRRKVTIRAGETTKFQVDLTKEAFPK
jgi:serine/threonine protein kinase